VQVLEAATGGVRTTFRNKGTMSALAFSPDGTKLAAASNDAPVYLWDVRGKLLDLPEAFDATTGDLKWEKTYAKAKFTPFFGEGPRSTPCVDGDKLYTYGNTGVLTCWNTADGKLIWQKDVLKDFKESNLVFGISTSPIVVDDKVLVMAGKGKAGVVAFNKKDGEVSWQGGGDGASYSSPIVIGEGAKRQIIYLTGANVLSLSPGGETLWKHPFVDALSESSTTPIKMSDFIIASSVKAGAVGLKLEEKEGKPSVTPSWKNPDLTCYFSTPVPVGKEHIYMMTGIASLTGASITLRCVETATGKEAWNRPKMGKFHAAILKLGDGNLLLHDDSGNLMLLAPNVKEYQELARGKVCDNTWAHPALANGKLYVRDGKELRCFQMGE